MPFSKITDMVTAKTSLPLERRCLTIGDHRIYSWQDISKHSPQVAGVSVQTLARLQFRPDSGLLSVMTFTGKKINIFFNTSDTVGSLKPKIRMLFPTSYGEDNHLKGL